MHRNKTTKESKKNLYSETYKILIKKSKMTETVLEICHSFRLEESIF